MKCKRTQLMLRENNEMYENRFENINENPSSNPLDILLCSIMSIDRHNHNVCTISRFDSSLCSSFQLLHTQKEKKFRFVIQFSKQSIIPKTRKNRKNMKKVVVGN